jgi:hypothetical protein
VVVLNVNYLDELLERYEPLSDPSIGALEKTRQRYAANRSNRLLDLAAVAAAMSIDGSSPPDPLVLQAIQDTNPNFDPSQLSGLTDTELMGVVSSAKGKYFEYLLAERLNQGEEVGGVLLPPGYEAVVAENMSQPGWDLQIVGPDGQASEFLQAKATDSAQYVSEALERYPDIQILATSEVASKLDESQMVLDASISNADLVVVTEGALESSGAGVLGQFWEQFNPLVPLMVVAVTQGYQIVVKKQSVSDAAHVAASRVARGATAMTVGTLVELGTDSFGWGIAAAIASGLLFDEVESVGELTAVVRESNQKLARRSAYYEQKPALGFA